MTSTIDKCNECECNDCFRKGCAMCAEEYANAWTPCDACECVSVRDIEYMDKIRKKCNNKATSVELACGICKYKDSCTHERNIYLKEENK